MSIYLKNTKKIKKSPKKVEPAVKPNKPIKPSKNTSDVTETLTEDQIKDALESNDAMDLPQQPEQQLNPMIIPEFFNNLRNNYYVANKIIWLTGEIVWEVVTEVMKRLNFYDDGSKEPITIYLSSPGGMCDAGWALVDMIEKLKSKHIEINTICAGSCSSMAAIILAAGTKGHRYAFPSSRIMIHQAGFGMIGPGGKLDEVANEVRELQYWTDLTVKYLSKITKKKTVDIQKALGYDNYMSAADAKKFGIVDKVGVVLS